MIQNRAMLNVADNSGAKSLQMIGLPARGTQRSARLGSVITAVVKKADPNGTVKDAEIVKAVIVRTRKEIRRVDGSYIRFDDNAAVVIDNAGNPKGTRIFGPVAREIRDRGFLRIVSLAPEVV